MAREVYFWPLFPAPKKQRPDLLAAGARRWPPRKNPPASARASNFKAHPAAPRCRGVGNFPAGLQRRDAPANFPYLTTQSPSFVSAQFSRRCCVQQAKQPPPLCSKLSSCESFQKSEVYFTKMGMVLAVVLRTCAVASRALQRQYFADRADAVSPKLVARSFAVVASPNDLLVSCVLRNPTHVHRHQTHQESGRESVIRVRVHAIFASKEESAL